MDSIFTNEIIPNSQINCWLQDKDQMMQVNVLEMIQENKDIP